MFIFLHLRYWCVGVQAVRQIIQRDIRAEGVRPVPRRRSSTRTRGPVRCRHWRLHPQKSRQRLPPVLHVQDGLTLRPRGRGGLGNARAGIGVPPCGGRLHHAQHRQRQPKRSHHHDGGEGRWHHQRSPRSCGFGGVGVPAADPRNPEVSEQVRVRKTESRTPQNTAGFKSCCLQLEWFYFFKTKVIMEQ